MKLLFNDCCSASANQQEDITYHITIPYSVRKKFDGRN